MKTKAISNITDSIIKRAVKLLPEYDEVRNYSDPRIKAEQYVGNDNSVHGSLSTSHSDYSDSGNYMGNRTTELRVGPVQYKDDTESSHIITNKMWSNGTGSDVDTSKLNLGKNEIIEESSRPSSRMPSSADYDTSDSLIVDGRRGNEETSESARNAINIFNEQRRVIAAAKNIVDAHQDSPESEEREA